MIRKILTTMVGALLALGIGAAGAYFTAQVQVPDSVIRGGTVAVSSEPTSAPLSIEALAPGVTTSRPMTIMNSGTLPCDVVVTASKKAGITDFYEALDCTVTCGDTQLYAGKMSSMRTAPIRLAPSARGELRFSVGLPSDADNALADDYAKLSLYVDAEQVH